MLYCHKQHSTLWPADTANEFTAVDTENDLTASQGTPLCVEKKVFLRGFPTRGCRSNVCTAVTSESALKYLVRCSLLGRTWRRTVADCISPRLPPHAAGPAAARRRPGRDRVGRPRRPRSLDLPVPDRGAAGSAAGAGRALPPRRHRRAGEDRHNTAACAALCRPDPATYVRCSLTAPRSSPLPLEQRHWCEQPVRGGKPRTAGPGGGVGRPPRRRAPGR